MIQLLNYKGCLAPHLTRCLSLAVVPALVGATAIALPSSALAQDGTTAPAGSADAPVVLDTLTVTARRAEEDARDVPFSISVISGDAIAEDGAMDVEQTLTSTPGVSIMSFGDTTNATMKIRGVGPMSRVGIDDSSVILYVDGMPQRMSDMSSQIFDVERLEVLKGPQGTLFGRNSEAGAVNLTSRRPTDVAEGYIRGEVGTGDHRMTEGALSGPIIGDLKGRLAFRYKSSDSWVENANDGKPLSEPEDLAVRGTLVWEPLDTTTVTVVGSHETLADYPAGLVVLRPYGEAPVADFDRDTYDEDKWSSRISAEVQHTLPFAVATLFSGYSRVDLESGQNFYEGRQYERLLGWVPDSYQRRILGQDTFNQELRLSARPEDDIFWVAGVNHYKSDWSYDRRDTIDGLSPKSPINADIDRDFGVESYALFGEITYPLFDRLKVTAGLRHTWEHKTYDAEWRANPSNPSPIRAASDHQTLDDDYTTGRFALGYDVTRDVTVYGVYAHGYKSGGWNQWSRNLANGLPDRPYEAASIDSYEIGVKSAFLDGDLRVNAAFFWNDIQDDHLMIYDPNTFELEAKNFDTETKGLEMDATWRMGHGFTLGGSLTYIDGSVTGVPGGATAGVTEGNDLPGVSEWGWSLSLAHELDLPSVLVFKDPTLISTIQNQYVGQRAADAANNFDLDSYNKLDVRLSLLTDNAEFYLRADNLLDERYDLYGFYRPARVPGGPDATIGAPAQGRSFVVGAAYHF